MPASRVIRLHPQRGADPDPPRLSSLPPLALYIHTPWCVRKCPYCDFNSHAVRGEGVPESAYLQALVADAEQALPSVWGRRVVSVFIGGGTPSLISPDGVEWLLAALRARLHLMPDAEITLEANPGTVDAGRFAAFRAAGVNRLSVGVQSFDSRFLQALGRIHDARDARAAVDAALASFDNVNVDLMYALPGQAAADVERDVRTAAATGVTHLSAYHLTLEPNTPFAAHPPPLPDADSAADMQERVEALLAEAGFRHYETSAFARPGRTCRHNLNYWQFGDYLGIGAGAHGKISSAAGIVREMRHRHPDAYLAGAQRGDFVHSRAAVATADLPFEFMMNALRLIDGVPAGLFQERTGLPLAAVLGPLQRARQRGLLTDDPARLQPTLQGQRFLNELLQAFLPDEDT